jgi:predicted transcriptional regulator
LKSIKILNNLSGKTAPGQTPDFTPTHVLLAILMINEEKIGRKQLSRYLNLGEGTVRNLIGRLDEKGLISISRQGASLSEKGEKFLEGVHLVMSGIPIDNTKLTVSEYNYAVIVRKQAHKIDLGIEQRDQALISGAKGATTIKYQGNEYMIPGVATKLDENVRRILGSLNPKNGDVIIIGTGNSELSAKMGAYSAGIALLSKFEIV